MSATGGRRRREPGSGAEAHVRHVPDRLHGRPAPRARQLGGAAAGRRGRGVRRQHVRIPVLPGSVEPVGRDVQLHREGDDRVRDGALDRLRRDRPVGRGDHRAGLDRDGLRGARSVRGRPCWCSWAWASGLACGAFNGLLVTRMGLPSIVATIGTMSLFRGIAYIVLGDEAYSGYPSSFAWFGQGYVGWVITVEMVLFAIVRRRLRASCCTRARSGAPSTRSATTRPRRCSRACACRA